jgi:hypothetical protein
VRVVVALFAGVDVTVAAADGERAVGIAAAALARVVVRAEIASLVAGDDAVAAHGRATALAGEEISECEPVVRFESYADSSTSAPSSLSAPSIAR